jgi:hypothetical protein
MFVEPGGTDVGPVRLTVGVVPPEWQLLHANSGSTNESLVWPAEYALAACAAPSTTPTIRIETLIRQL